MTRVAYVAIGANLGNARATVLQAMDDLQQLPETCVAVRSSLYRSAPIDAGGPDFINAVVALETDLDAPHLLAHMQQLEQRAGRERPYPNAPRTLDLDLLIHGDGELHSRALTLPHPRMAQRAFVLLPLAEIAPDQVSAQQLAQVAGQSIRRL